MEGAIELRSLRDRPYELLREVDRRARAAAQGGAETAVAGTEWVGVAFRLGGEAFLMAREETREVMGFRRFHESEFSADLPPTLLRCERYLAGTFKRGPEVWPVFSVRILLESPAFQQAAAS